MAKIGLLVGRENTFPPAFIEHVNGRGAGVTAEYVLLGGSKLNEPAEYAVIIDRISHEIPYYRSYLKNAALNGTIVINSPFWFPADDKFIGSAIADRLGVAVPRTLALPNHDYIPDISRESLRNLTFPLPWQEFVDYTGLPAFLKPSVGGGWKFVFKVNSVDELIHAYDQTGQLPMILQEAIEFEDYVRCICLGGDKIMPLRYNPRNPNMFERYEGEADAAHLGAALHRRVVDDATRLNQALGYTMNTVEFAIRDGIPYAIDFLNPACDLDSFSLGAHAFEWALNTLADLAIDYSKHGETPAHEYRWRQAIRPAAATPARATRKSTKAATPAADNPAKPARARAAKKPAGS
ncbi:MAG TPA: hypothetical protein VNL35_23035 [Chloroflexota bacterium]|nr:hypothetical protein [Chloroflexota bacterium]